MLFGVMDPQTKTRRKRRWSHEGDHHIGPLLFNYSKGYNPWAIIMSSGSNDRENPGCCVRFQAFGVTLICELPPIVKPWRKWVDTSKYEWASKDGPGGYWDEHPREYGFRLSDGHLHVNLGAYTHDSETTQDWGCFLPWTQWRHVRHSLYDLDGKHFWTEEEGDVKLGMSRYDAMHAAREACPTASFAFIDYDDEEGIAKTRIEEREWHFGTGYFKWLSLFRRPKIHRSLDIEFSGETGPEKGSWKGGTTGTSIEMRPGELHEAAFARYCAEEHRSKYRRYRISFAGSVEPKVQP